MNFAKTYRPGDLVDVYFSAPGLGRAFEELSSGLVQESTPYELTLMLLPCSRELKFTGGDPLYRGSNGARYQIGLSPEEVSALRQRLYGSK